MVKRKDVPFVRSAFNYDPDHYSKLSGYADAGEDMAVQSAKDECDINTIVRRFGLTGELPQGVQVPDYQIFDEVFDFQSAMNAVRTAQESFNAMPADVRARFNNDPQRFVEFCSDKKNLVEMRQLGLAVPEEKSDDIPPSSEEGKKDE